METKEQLFKRLLLDLECKKEVCDEFKYVGTGNPLSNILIIGKESSLINEEQYKNEILGNFNQWQNLKSFKSDKIRDRYFQNYSPVYPYKGQILAVDNGKNFGTSKTWMNYQKLINCLFKNSNNKIIDFHENSFITEVNSTPSRKTAKAKIDSISFRKNSILVSDFFRSFPIVIISGVGYFENSVERNEIENIFEVNFTEKKYANKEKNTQPYWIHYNKEKTKILINTNQLSIGISNLLLEEVAKEIINSNLLK